ncbi:MAG: type I secretion system permease/ATPase, partial [Pseudomonadota bacterium]
MSRPDTPTRSRKDAAPDRPRDPLAEGLAALAAHFGRPISVDGLKTGLPLVGGRLPAEHVEIAAGRLGLKAEWCTLDLKRVAEHDLPLLVEGHDGAFEILWSLERSGRSGGFATLSRIQAPAERVALPLPEFKAYVTGRALQLRPESGLDGRADTAITGRGDHWFFSAFRDCRPIYAQAIAATLALNILALAVPLFSMNVYDRVIPNAAEETLWALALGVGIAILFDFLIRTIRGVFVDLASQRADVRLANAIYGRLIGARPSKQPPSIGVRANTMREFETLREFFTSATLTAFGDLPFVFLFVGVMYLIAGNIAFVVLAAIPVLLLIGWITQRRLNSLVREAFREVAQKNAVVTESLIGFDAIKAASAESWAAGKWEKVAAAHIRTGHHIKLVTNLGLHAIQACQTSVQVLVVVLGFYAIAAGEMTMGALIASSILSGRAMQPLSQAATLLARLNSARMAYQAIAAIAQAPQDRTPGEPGLSRETVAGALRFEDVAFRFADDAPRTLEGLNFEIAPGERVALLGTIGSGKSTILRLAQAHLAPEAGRVLLDNVAVSQFDAANLRRHVGLLLQGADLFHGTIRENIALGRPDVTDADLLVAARAGGCLDWIVRLPRGFDTVVLERGAGLSGGQRQSVALARTLVGLPQVLLLDEPTSDMDTGTERRVVERLAKHLDGRTLVAVTHRP